MKNLLAFFRAPGRVLKNSAGGTPNAGRVVHTRLPRRSFFNEIPNVIPVPYSSSFDAVLCTPTYLRRGIGAISKASIQQISLLGLNCN